MALSALSALSVKNSCLNFPEILPRNPPQQRPNFSTAAKTQFFYRSTLSFRNDLHAKISPVSATASTEPFVEETDETNSEKFDWFSQWYPVAPVCDLDKRAPHAKRILGIDIVVWWDRNQEKWQVFEDKCPHRLAPLSQGRIDQWGRLQCVYHGWCFDGNANCKYIPQAPPDGPPIHTFKKACATAYPCMEQNNIVWFWPNTNPLHKDIHTKKKPPYIQEIDDPSFSHAFGIRDIPYGYEVLVENLMDPSHVPYAHYGIMAGPGAGIRKNSALREKADREGGRPVNISVQTLDISGFFASQELGDSKFVAPCLFYVFPRSQSPLSTEKTQKFILVFLCIPVSPGRSRLIWTFPRNFAILVDRIIPRWVYHMVQNLILDSDLFLLHLEEKKLAEAGASNWNKACFVPTKADALIVGFRKWFSKYSNSRVIWGTHFNEGLPPSPPKDQLMDRYWSHVVHCSSCSKALKGLKAFEIALQVISLASVGIVAAAKKNMLSTTVRFSVVIIAVAFFLASKWMSSFIYKNFYFHDYNHAFR